PIEQMLDAPEIRRARAPHRADDLVALREQQFSEVGSVLAGDSRDNGSFRHVKNSRQCSMTTDDDRDRPDREPRDADAAYNAALTALDRAVVETQGRALARDDFDRVATSLILLLQKITAFVETKDRALAADGRAEIARVNASLEALAELKTQIGIVQRALRAAGSSDGSSAAAAAATASATPASTSAVPYDVVYLAFEDEFRGSDEVIATRLRHYLPRFAGASDVVDLGCGRGE